MPAVHFRGAGKHNEACWRIDLVNSIIIFARSLVQSSQIPSWLFNVFDRVLSIDALKLMLFRMLFLMRSIMITSGGLGEIIGPSSGLFLQQSMNSSSEPHGHNSSSCMNSWSAESLSCFMDLKNVNILVKQRHNSKHLLLMLLFSFDYEWLIAYYPK